MRSIEHEFTGVGITAGKLSERINIGDLQMERKVMVTYSG